MSEQSLVKKVVNIIWVCLLIICIGFAAFMFVLNYHEKGETNMPFTITKISIISTVDGQDVENQDNKWAIKAIQNNDIYIYIEKNKGYSEKETLKSVKLDNFKIKENPKIGQIELYKPINDELVLYKNLEENKFEELVYTGTQASNMKNLEISNQGGVVSFRCANNNIGTYLSNEDMEIKFSGLLEKLQLNEEDLKSIITCDISFYLDSDKIFKTENVEFKIPNEGLVNKGTVGIENTDLSHLVFKRVEK